MKIPFWTAWRMGRAYERELEKLPPEVSALIRASLPRYNISRQPLDVPVDYAKLIAEYSGWAYACAMKNASAVAAVPMRLYRGTPRSGTMRPKVATRPVSKALKDKFFANASLIRMLNKSVEVEEVLEHPWLVLQNEVNQFLNGFTLIQLTILFKQVTGNAYWVVPKSPQGTPTEIWVAPAQYMRIVPDVTTFIKAYVYGVGDKQESFEPNVITHFKYPNPRSLYYGMGPLEAAFTAVKLNNDFDEYEAAMLENGAHIPGYLTSEQPIGHESLLRESKQFSKLFGGKTKAGRLGVLQSGLKLLPLAWNPKDINYAIGMKMTKEKIAGVFGVPLSKLTVEDVNRANADAGNYSYMKDTITPECISLADTINQDIMPCYDEKLFVAHDDCVPEDKDFNLQEEESRLKTGVYSINDVLEAAGKEPKTGGEEPLVSSSLVPLSRAIAEPEPVPPAFVDNDDEDGVPQEPGSEDEEERMFTRGHKEILPPGEEAHVERVVVRWMDEQFRIIEKHISPAKLTNATDLVNAVEWHLITQRGVDILLPLELEYMRRGAEFAARRIGTPTDFGNHPILVDEWSRKHLGKNITAINEQTRLAITTQIGKQLSDGKPYAVMAKELRSQIGLNAKQTQALATFRTTVADTGVSVAKQEAVVARRYSDMIRQRANMIARTETASGYSQGALNQYKHRGIGWVEWSAAGDACEICMPYDGKQYLITEAGGLQPLHPNCRCDWRPLRYIQ